MLEQLGYTVLEAAAPYEPSSIAGTRREPVDLLITNVALPGSKSGPRFAAELMAFNRRLKVLFSSTTPMAQWSDEDFQAMAKMPVGSYSFLAKPFRAEELALKLEQLLLSGKSRP